MTFSGDGRKVIAAGRRDDPIEYRNGGIVVIYAAKDGQIIHEINRREVFQGAIGSDGRMLVVGTSPGGPATMHLVGIELATGQIRWVNPPDEEEPGVWPITAMQFQPNSPFLDVVLKTGNIMCFNSLTGHEKRSLHQGERSASREATISADGTVLMTGSNEMVYVWDVETGRPRGRIPSRRYVDCHIAVSPDGKTLAVSTIKLTGTSL